MKHYILLPATIIVVLSSCSERKEESPGISCEPSVQRIELGPRQSLSVTIQGRDELTMRIGRRGDKLVAFVAENLADAPTVECRRIELVAESNAKGSLTSFQFSREPVRKVNLGLHNPSAGVVFEDVDADGLPDYRSDAFGVYRAKSITWERIDSGGTIPDVPVDVIQSISALPDSGLRQSDQQPGTRQPATRTDSQGGIAKPES